MSSAVANELEERRVIRLLAGAAEAVPPLRELDVEDALTRAAARACVRRRSFTLRPLSVAGIAATVALAVFLPLRQQEPDRHSSSTRISFEAQLVAFPEGSALSLLLARPVERRA